MGYSAQTLSYLKKHLWLPIIAFFIPAAVSCFLSTPYWEVTFVTAFRNYDPYISQSKTFFLLFGDSWSPVWPVVLIAVLQVTAASFVMSAMDTHFRTGRLSARSPFRLINNTIGPVAIGVVVMSAVSIIFRFLLFGLVVLIQFIAETAGLPGYIALIMISVVALGLFVLHIFIIQPMLMLAPIMFIYGYKFRDAAASSFKMVYGRKMFPGLFIPMIACVGLQLLVGFLHLHIAVIIVMGFVVFYVTNMYVTVYTMIAFYDVSGLDRRDIMPYKPIPLPIPPKKDKDKEKDGKDNKDNENSEGGANSKEPSDETVQNKTRATKKSSPKKAKPKKPSEKQNTASKKSKNSGATSKAAQSKVKGKKPSDNKEKTDEKTIDNIKDVRAEADEISAEKTSETAETENTEGAGEER